jgi:UDP-glucose 4-epimerase
MNYHRVLITGASSPIGGALAALLRQDNSAVHITGLSRKGVGAPFDRYVCADLGQSVPSIEGEFDLVVHAGSAVPATVTSDADFEAVNVVGSMALLGGLQLAQTCGILNISSLAIYDDPTAKELTEDSAKTTANAYGASKLKFEEALGDLVRPGMSILSLRIPVLLVKDVKNNFVSKWALAVQSGDPITLFNPDGLLNAVVDELEIHQFAMSYLAGKPGGHLICNLSSSNPIPVREAAHIFLSAVGHKVPIIEKQAPKPAQTVSHSRAVAHGYRPRSVSEVLAKYARRSINPCL